MKSYLDYKGFEVLAHRGGSIESYENTVESFQYSVELVVSILKPMFSYHLMESLTSSMMTQLKD